MKMKHGTKKRLKVNIMYARVRSAFNWVQCVLTSKRRVLTWGRRVPASAFACQGSMPWQANTIHFLIFLLPSWGIEPNLAMPTRGRVAPRWGYVPQVRTRPQRIYIYTCGISASIICTREITPFMFFNTKRKIFVPIICSFKAESVLLPCYTFPAKKSLKKVSFFKSLVYNVLRI